MLCLQVQKKGTKEGVKGEGSLRAITEEDFQNFTTILQKHGWDFEITDAQSKALENGRVPPKLKGLMADASGVLTTSTHCVAHEVSAIIVCKLSKPCMPLHIQFYTFRGNLCSGT